MDISETSKLLALLAELWPNQSTSRETCVAWHMLLVEENLCDMLDALKCFAKSKSSPFPPNVTELLAIATKMKIEKVKALPAPKIASSSNDEVTLELVVTERHELTSKGTFEKVKRSYYRCSRGALLACQQRKRTTKCA